VRSSHVWDYPPVTHTCDLLTGGYPRVKPDERRRVSRDHTQDALDELARQQAEGTHNPATECPACGTWRTPGQVHTRGDDQATHRTTRVNNQCNG
jgi:hypothetical protein